MYHLTYWLHGQSRLFSEPQHFCTNTFLEFSNAVATAINAGYDIADLWYDKYNDDWNNRLKQYFGL